MLKKIPEFLMKKINEQYSNENSKMIVDGLLSNRKTTFRVNRIKATTDEICKELNINNISFSKTKLFEDAFIIDNNYENNLRNLDIYKEGKIYLQSLSSMVPVLVLQPQDRENILDMCSAPRGKNYSNCKHNK